MHTYETVALPRLSEFTAQQLVLTLHGYEQSGIVPLAPSNL